MSRRRGFFLVFALSGLVAACGNDSPGRSGTTSGGSTTGGFGTCTSISDCADGQVCSADGLCMDVQCSATQPCTGGAQCINGLCEGGDTGGGTGADGGTDGTPTTAAPGSCSPCTDDSECSGALVCTQVGPSKHCTAPCDTNADCVSGWQCFGADGASTCVPGLFQCTGCLISGCEDPAAPFCNASSGSCVAPLEVCQSCQNDGQCGLGQRCWGEGNTKACVTECPDNQCPGNGSCVDREGVEVCRWMTEGDCCFGDQCQGDIDPCAQCAGVTPHCIGGSCVQCVNDGHCTDPALPNCVANVCKADGGSTNPECTGATPFWNESTNSCVQCLDSSHCSGNQCNGGTCQTGGDGGEVCNTCVDPYPGCAEFQGQWVCVQCSEDSHCSQFSAGVCNLTNWTCEGATGVGPASGQCQSDGCDSGALCDDGTGLCYNEDGTCNNLTSFCPGGLQCLDFFSQLGLGGGGGGLPFPLPTDPGTATSNCECNSDADCAAGQTCGPNGIAFFLSLLDPSIQPPSICQEPAI